MVNSIATEGIVECTVVGGGGNRIPATAKSTEDFSTPFVFSVDRTIDTGLLKAIVSTHSADGRDICFGCGERREIRDPFEVVLVRAR